MKTLIITMMMTISLNALALDCSGTEPFWGAKVETDNVELYGPGYETPLNLAVTSVSGAQGYAEDFLKVFSNENRPVATVTANRCTDGMSDYVFPQEVVIFTGNGVLYGCCGEGILEDEGQ